MTEPSTALDDIKVHVKVKISALWASLMFCYIYGDYFGLYKPGTLQDMLAGKMGPLGPTTQVILLGTSAMMAIPSVMVFLSLVLRPSLNRWLNIIRIGIHGDYAGHDAGRMDVLHFPWCD